MKLKPDRWTEHHNVRLFHVSLLASFLMICAVVFSGLFFILANSFANAFTDTQQANVTASATVPEFSSGTTTTISTETGGGWSYFAPNSTTTTSTNPSLAYQFPPATITMQADPNISQARNIASPKGSQRVIYVFQNDRPRFLGETNIDNGFIYISVEGPMSFSSSAQADGNGLWQWQSPEALPAGVYTILAIVQDPWHLERTASATLEFAVGKLGTVPPPVKPPAGQAEILHLLVKVPQPFKVVHPGQQVGIAVRILTQNLGQKNLVLEYAISNSQGVVGTYQDSVQVNAGGAEFLKIFYTNPLAEPGDYTITVRVHEAGRLFSAADTFSVQGRGIIPTSGIMFVDFTTIFQILLVLFLLFGLISYFEYNKVVVMSRIIKQVSEEDIKKEEEKGNDTNDKMANSVEGKSEGKDNFKL